MSLSITVDVKEDKADKRRLERLRRTLIKAARSHVDIGFFDGKPHPKTGESEATVAAINEFGVPSLNIPERPFMATAARNTQVGAAIALEMKRNLTNQRGQFRWNAIGDFYANEVKVTIEGFSEPPNAPLTISLKGFDNPLVETGHMMRNVDTRVVRDS
jgi:hypothetical protein